MIKIDADKCNGCGICVNACHEGALEIVNGKAKIIKDDYCDGLGNCLPVCPTDAISFEMREAADFDEEAVVENMIKLGKPVPEDLQGFIKTPAPTPDAKPDGTPAPTPDAKSDAKKQGSLKLEKFEDISQKQEKISHQCPGSMAKSLTPKMPLDKNALMTDNKNAPEINKFGTNKFETNKSEIIQSQNMHSQLQASQAQGAQLQASQLAQWPVQIKLAPVNAQFFKDAHLLIAADCCAYAYANFHGDFMRNKVTLIGCPKLDDCDYSEKLTEIIANNNLKSVTVVRMEVPCCSGMEKAVTIALKQAFQKTDKLIPWQVVTLSTDGTIIE